MFGTTIQYTKKVPKLGDFPENSWVWHTEREEMFLMLPKKVVAFGRISKDLFDFRKEITKVSKEQVHYMGEDSVVAVDPRSRFECIIPLQWVIIADTSEDFGVEGGNIEFWIGDVMVGASPMPIKTGVKMIFPVKDAFITPGKPLTVKLSQNPVSGFASLKIHTAYQIIEL